MIRAGLLVAALFAAIGPAGAAEDDQALEPSTSYVTMWTTLGALGGSAFGAALGGLSRPGEADPVKPFLRWGGIGAGIGGVLAYEVSRAAALGHGDDPALAPPATRETGACFGALVGEALGLGLGSLAAGNPVDRNSREVWVGVSLGALVGAGAGFLARPLGFLQPPRPRVGPTARLQRSHEATQPLVETDTPALREVRRAELHPGVAVEPFPHDRPAEMAELRRSLLAIETAPAMAAPAPLDAIRHSVLASAPLPPSEQAADLLQIIQVLAVLHGAALGAGTGGLIAGGNGTKVLDGAAVGAGLGVLVGWSAGAALDHAWDRSDNGVSDEGERLATGRRTAALFAGGLGGALAGIAAGAAVHNLKSGMTDAGVAGYCVAGDLLGLAAGYLIQSARE